MKAANNQASVSITPDDENSIDELFRKLSDAWACGDGAAYASLFLDDAQFVGVFGFRLIGYNVIRDRHQKMFNGIFKFSRIDEMRDKVIHPLTPDVVLIYSDGDVYFPGESPATLKPSGLRTLSLVKRNGLWKVASFQNTPTGSFRHVKFIWRFLSSRIYLLRPQWKTTYTKILDEKRAHIEHW